MSLQLLASRRLTVLLLLVAAGLISALATGDLVRSHDGPHQTSSTALLTTDRTGLKICVASLIPGLDGRTAQGQVRGMMTKIANHPDYQTAGLGRQPVVVDPDCPGDPTITAPDYRRDGLGAAVRVTTPSPYRLFVYVAAPEQLVTMFGWDPRITTREVLCEGGSCGAVTGELYVTPDELRDPQYLERALTRGVGLWPVGEPRYDPRPLPTASPR